MRRVRNAVSNDRVENCLVTVSQIYTAVEGDKLGVYLKKKKKKKKKGTVSN